MADTPAHRRRSAVRALNVATLLIAHHVLDLGGMREAGRVLGCSISTISAAVSRLQSHMAIRLTTTAGSRLLPTLEGRRLGPDLAEAARHILEMAAMTPAGMPLARRAVRLSVSLLALERFIVVARVGSIRRAAGEVRLGQPQLTRQMRALEETLGGDLFERSSRGVSLTARGETLLGLAERLDAIWHRIVHGASDRFRRGAAMTRLGSVSPIGSESRIARMLAALAAAWPERRPRGPLFISSEIAEHLIAGLGDGIYDLVLLDTEAIPAHFARRAISRSPLVLVGSAEVIRGCGHDLERALTTRPIVAPSLRSGLRQKLASLIEREIPQRQRDRLRLIEIDSIPVIANLVREHGYVTLLPQSALRAGDGAIDSIGLPGDYDIQLVLAWRPVAAVEPAVELVFDILGERQVMREDLGPTGAGVRASTVQDSGYPREFETLLPSQERPGSEPRPRPGRESSSR